MVLVDARAVNVAPVIDPVAAVVLCADVSNIETVLVDGRFRKRDGRLLADLDKAVAGVTQARDRLTAAAGAAAAQAAEAVTEQAASEEAAGTGSAEPAAP